LLRVAGLRAIKFFVLFNHALLPFCTGFPFAGFARLLHAVSLSLTCLRGGRLVAVHPLALALTALFWIHSLALPTHALALLCHDRNTE
jgi:hypothetical protein